MARLFSALIALAKPRTAPPNACQRKPLTDPEILGLQPGHGRHRSLLDQEPPFAPHGQPIKFIIGQLTVFMALGIGKRR